MSAPAAVASRSSLLPLVVGWSAVLLWGGSPIATRIAVSGIDPVTTGVLRTPHDRFSCCPGTCLNAAFHRRHCRTLGTALACSLVVVGGCRRANR
jgi:hypothetical protein